MSRSVLPVILIPLLFALPATWLVLSTSQLELHAMLNQYHNAWFDKLFVWGTNIADGLVLLIVAIALLFLKSKRAGFYFASSAVVASVITQFLKRVPFAEHMRPGNFLDEMSSLRIPEGVELASYYSFPSGHSTAAFVMCVSLACIYQSRNSSITLGLLAAFAAYTRVWISMHFLEDILVGAFIGGVTALLLYGLFYKGKNAERMAWDLPLFKRKHVSQNS